MERRTDQFYLGCEYRQRSSSCSQNLCRLHEMHSRLFVPRTLCMSIHIQRVLEFWLYRCMKEGRIRSTCPECPRNARVKNHKFTPLKSRLNHYLEIALESVQSAGKIQNRLTYKISRQISTSWPNTCLVWKWQFS